MRGSRRMQVGPGRPRNRRRMGFSPTVDYFKPRRVPMSELEEIILFQEEVEALRLKNIEELDQNDCAEKMNISQSTFQRILSSAYKKTSQALVLGKAIRINKQP